MGDMINFETTPSQYRHWRVEYDGEVARLIMDVDETGGLFEGYELKLNSYDLGVDIELLERLPDASAVCHPRAALRSS